MNFSKLDGMLIELNKLRPLDPYALDKLAEALNLEMIYNSNAIEGNTLTLNETYLVVSQGVTVSGKSWKEHLEASNLFHANTFAQEIVSDGVELSEYLVKQIHHIVMSGIHDAGAGTYRKVDVRISGSAHVPPSPMFVQEEMEKLFDWYRENLGKVHPVELAALFHHKLVYIHPFIDGNGRTTRLCMNFILMQNGYPPIILKGDEQSRGSYYTALEKASVEKDYSQFLELVYDRCEEILEIYINGLSPGGMSGSYTTW